jgi:hypothetical protein
MTQFFADLASEVPDYVPGSIADAMKGSTTAPEPIRPAAPLVTIPRNPAARRETLERLRERARRKAA